jgi:isoquinoline 1-oxidoreductase beta subunit
MSVYLPDFMQKLHAQRAEEAASLSRRGFIKLTGLAGGGLVLAAALPQGKLQAQQQPSGGASFDANPYVQIQPDGKIVLFAKYGPQFAGGSLSIPMNYDTLRKAGATARAMLVAAAAKMAKNGGAR